MKKILFALVAVLTLVSCSKDDNDNAVAPTDGQYVCDALGAYFSAVLSNGKCVEFTVYTNGEYFGCWRDSDIISSGRYPQYKYTVDGSMDISVEFSSPNSFGALLNGALRESYDDNPMATGWSFAIETTAPVQFNLAK